MKPRSLLGAVVGASDHATSRGAPRTTRIDPSRASSPHTTSEPASTGPMAGVR